MKLYNIRRKVHVHTIADVRVPVARRIINVDEVIMFSHLDGMYSVCYNQRGELVHLVAYAEVMEVEAPKGCLCPLCKHVNEGGEHA